MCNSVCIFVILAAIHSLHFVCTCINVVYTFYTFWINRNKCCLYGLFHIAFELGATAMSKRGAETRGT